MMVSRRLESGQVKEFCEACVNLVGCDFTLTLALSLRERGHPTPQLSADEVGTGSVLRSLISNRHSSKNFRMIPTVASMSSL